MQNTTIYNFPFGEPLNKVLQSDRTPNKKVFVLGVYASAVHARWIDANGKEKIKACAVASEPYIFWKGDDAQNIISKIYLPAELGRLELPTDRTLNGPSGVALDELFLDRLGVKRNQAWLCDLLPESRVNPQQRKALGKHYTKEVIEKYSLPFASIPNFDKNELKRNSKTRHLEILSELEESGAKHIILLGDLPIKWFLNFFDKKYISLSQFGNTKDSYGQKHQIEINGKQYFVLPLCHPRNAARLGLHKETWAKLHDNWNPDKI